MFYEVIEKIMDSRDASAGGGAASAVAGAMAAGLVGMAARLSLGKGYGLSDERYEEIAGELDECVEALKKGSVADTEAYRGIKAAFTLPGTTVEEKKTRGAAIEKAAIRAAEVPLENGRAAQKILFFCKEMEGNFNINTKSDMEAGIMLAQMAVTDTALNIEANLSLIKTPEINAHFAACAEELKNSPLNKLLKGGTTADEKDSAL